MPVRLLYFLHNEPFTAKESTTFLENSIPTDTPLLHKERAFDRWIFLEIQLNLWVEFRDKEPQRHPSFYIVLIDKGGHE
jgi:ligand-binding SRPBCC domain-containing protein